MKLYYIIGYENGAASIPYVKKAWLNLDDAIDYVINNIFIRSDIYKAERKIQVKRAMNYIQMVEIENV